VTPLEAYEAARDRHSGAVEAQRLVKQLVLQTEAESARLRRAAAEAVSCPSCSAEEDEPCVRVGKYGSVPCTPHGTREDLSGVCGEFSRTRMLSRLGST